MTTPTDQRKALEEAFRAIWPEPRHEHDLDMVEAARRWQRFTAMLDAGAWLSAAEMLLGEDIYLDEMSRLDRAGRFNVCVWNGDEAYDRTGDTLTSALLSAILAARGRTQ